VLPGKAMNKQENVPMPVVSTRNPNWRIWVGFLLAVAALPSYIGLFVRFPVTRNGWTSWLMFATAASLLWEGVRRAFRSPDLYRGKIIGPILAVVSLAGVGLFGYATMYSSRQLPPSMGAPRVGVNAPEFTLADASGKQVTLSMLLSEPLAGRQGPEAKPRGVLLVFYRGYW
jgi:hypothetical protein